MRMFGVALLLYSSLGTGTPSEYNRLPYPSVVAVVVIPIVIVVTSVVIVMVVAVVVLHTNYTHI